MSTSVPRQAIPNACRYGQLLDFYGVGDITDMKKNERPEPGAIFQQDMDLLWYDDDSNNTQFWFIDSPFNSSGVSAYSVFSSRTINTTYSCWSTQLDDLTNTTGTHSIAVPGQGDVTFPDITPYSSAFYTNANNQCGSRCSVVEALEINDNTTWYYNCNVTMSLTQNDPWGYSHISDEMARMATSSIAQTGYADPSGISVQIYPLDTPFGYPVYGDEGRQGGAIAQHGLAAVAGAALYSPNYLQYYGMAPSQGQVLIVGHPKYFYLIIGLICGVHLLLCVIVAVLSNRVMVGPDGHLSMGLLLRPIAEVLDAVSGGRENKPFRDAKRQTEVRYEKARNGRWILNMQP